MEGLSKFLADLESNQLHGHFELPTGSGKTALGAVIADIFHPFPGNTVILSPYTKIAKQTEEEFADFADLDVANYFAKERKLDRKIINTTDKSLRNLIEQQKIKPEDITLLFLDEAHLFQGDELLKLLDKMPNAVMVGLTATGFFRKFKRDKLEGKISPESKWLQLFEHTYHSVELEDMMEDGTLAKARVFEMTTDIKVKDEEGLVNSLGQYSPKKLEKVFEALSRSARNTMIIGMLAGYETVAQELKNMPEAKVKEIQYIYEQLRERQTVVFGISIPHIELLAKVAQEKGVRGEAIHSQLPPEEVNARFERYAKGETQVLFGVNMLSTGYNSPQTKGMIIADETLSPEEAKQRFGRGLRKWNDMDLFAVELNDDWRLVSPEKRPILIPDLFDKKTLETYIHRGMNVAMPRVMNNNNSEPRRHRTAPVNYIDFQGADINFTLEEVLTRNFLRSKFAEANVSDIRDFLEYQAARIMEDNPGQTTIGFYNELLKSIPYFTPSNLVENAARMITSGTKQEEEAAIEVLVLSYLRSIISPLRAHMIGDDSYDGELLQGAIFRVTERLNKPLTDSQLRNLPQTIQREVKEFIKSLDIISDADWHQVRVSKNREEAETKLRENKVEVRPFTEADEEELAQFVEDIVDPRLRREEAIKLLNSLSERKRKIMYLRFFQDMTLDEIGKQIGMTGSGIRQIEAQVLRDLRKSKMSKQLKELIES